LFLVFSFLATVFLVAQKQGHARVDSLITALPLLKDDTAKIKVLNEISFLFRSFNPAEGIRYGEQGLAMAG